MKKKVLQMFFSHWNHNTKEALNKMKVTASKNKENSDLHNICHCNNFICC